MNLAQFSINNDYLTNMLANSLFKRLFNGSIDYVADTPLGGTSATVKFAGEYQGRPVVWLATVKALNGTQNGQPSHASAQYIDVFESPDPANEVMSVEIGLFVSQIDEPTVIKVITMIRQYKNLRQGRHEFSGTRK